MNRLNFVETFPDESTCKAKFKACRDMVGVRCSKCGNRTHYWKKDKECYECKDCKARATLRSSTVMHQSKLPCPYWFIAMHLLTATQKTCSAKEIQRQSGHNRYQPIWHMLHRLRQAISIEDTLEKRYSTDF